ncbi:hypothetical protein MANES_08G103711v8 [Manihot esculenta]|uniref:Uncharacterized protein n=1 Tax=Manihot esculenta TaxID=3983 RepID=A0ACB7HAC6_MANES|nr:hypothetical protein MANES_08G103711v8 [Manihot esculenta]
MTTKSSSFIQPTIPIFDGHYDHCVENVVHVAVEEDLTATQKKTPEDQKLKDLKVKNFLFQALNRSILEMILKKDTTKDIWDSLKQKYQGTTRTVNEYIARTLSIANKMKANVEDKGDDTSTLNIDEQESSLLHALKTSHGYEYGGRGRGNGRYTWFLDSGCNNHMCGKKEYFFDLDENFRNSMKLGNNLSLIIKSKGNIRLIIRGLMQTITNVFYVYELKNNLLSIRQLQEKGLAIIFQRNKCKVYH